MPIAFQNHSARGCGRPLASYKATGRPQFRLHRYFQGWSLIPVLLWLGMWANLNSGFWNIVYPTSGNEWQLMIRAVIPLVALPGSAVLLCLSKDRLPLGKPSPNGLLLIYGCIAALATIASPVPEASIYWSITFLATILCTWLVVKRKSSWLSARHMLEATWIICFVALTILAYLGRQSLFSSTGSEMAYGISEELHDMSRSSGVGRWAAIPGLVFLLRAVMSGSIRSRITYGAASLFCLFVVYRLQSRGAVFGLIGALIFATLVNRKFQRPSAVLAIWLVLAVIASIGIARGDSPAALGQSASRYVHRGQSSEEFRSMTGRTRAYKNGLAAFWESPFLGMGQWADRLNPKVGEHIHNSFLQSLLNGGAIGFLPYLGSWIAGWTLFYRLWKKRSSFGPVDQRRLAEAGTIMAFFTLRAIPETTTASFSVDLMVMVAVYCYMEALSCAVLKPVVRRLPPRLPRLRQVAGAV